MRGLVVAGAAFTLLVCGCSSAKQGGPFAGLSDYDADTRAQHVLATEEDDPSSPLFGRFLSIANETHGTRPGGGPAWVATLETRAHKGLSTCLYLWGHFAAFNETVTYVLDDCPSAV